MRMSHRPNCPLASVLFLLSLASVAASAAQDIALLPATSASLAADSPAQASTPQQGTTVPPQNGPKQLNNYFEAGGDYLSLSNGFEYWAGGYARGVITKGKNIWNGEVNGQHEFGDEGVYFGGGDTYTFNSDWYGSLTAGSSVAGFFWPRFRADAFLNKKWMERKQLITNFGFGYYAAKDPHRDHSFFVGTTYYFEKPWIVEEGIRFNISNPGSVFSPAGFVALTQGRNRQHYVTIRAGFGKEAYQLIGPTVELTDFCSQTLTITWRQWVGKSWGVNLVGDYYHSPFYQRGGSSFGFFKEF